MSNQLKNLLKNPEGSNLAAFTKKSPPIPSATASSNPDLGGPERGGLSEIVGTEIQAVVGGALQRIHFASGTNPANVKALLLSLDPNAKFETDFPRRGGFGNKETKKGRALGITVEISDTFKRIDLICMGGDGEEELKCAVSKRNAEEWLPKLEALDRLSEKHIEKIRAAFSEKGAATFLTLRGRTVRRQVLDH